MEGGVSYHPLENISASVLMGGLVSANKAGCLFIQKQANN